MGKLFRSWFFFTALLLFLLSAAVALPEMKARLFGRTEQAVAETAESMENRARAVWASLSP